MKRLYYLTPTLQSAERVSESLHEHGVTDWHFHILSKDEAGLTRRRLHSANVLHKLDLIHSMERGLLCGGLLGGSFVITAMIFSELGDLAPPAVWIALLVFCVLAGTWIGGMAGVNMENYKIRRFHDAIDKGMHLLMIDVPKEDETVVKTLLAQQHPDAVEQGEDSTIINPFTSEDGKVHIV
ncbi:hypothetical protein [Hahella sp. HN01]|uniref:hypothetical protein n=1 Tax=Hahella sp. HN01 TaxID=2847262 RepID=UPI001C1F0388|nr:hypothetical protein [Hahella sp. HN01]MBU6951093.1 hypothetical protein [Hahella sp. HN01]